MRLAATDAHRVRRSILTRLAWLDTYPGVIGRYRSTLVWILRRESQIAPNLRLLDASNPVCHVGLGTVASSVGTKRRAGIPGNDARICVATALGSLCDADSRRPLRQRPASAATDSACWFWRPRVCTRPFGSVSEWLRTGHWIGMGDARRADFSRAIETSARTATAARMTRWQ